jgi:hypothetical protein
MRIRNWLSSLFIGGALALFVLDLASSSVACPACSANAISCNAFEDAFGKCKPSTPAGQCDSTDASCHCKSVQASSVWHCNCVR